MNKKNILAFFFLLILGILLSAVLFFYSRTSAVLNPKGIIALKELDLMVAATLLMLIVVIPVCLMTFFICLRYRASHKTAKYAPDWDNNWTAEGIWWGFPFVIIVILSILTWKSSHDLDPFKPIESDAKPITIQVVALQWKWLFIYPEQKIASVNFVQFPEKTPVNFEITADAPMNSFWIPQLGGQIYAMPGMRTKLHLIADEEGDYRGSSANLSGVGFSRMTFTAKSSTQDDFQEWVQGINQSSSQLGKDEYKKLAQPSINSGEFFTLKDEGLYDQIVMKYMSPPPIQNKIEDKQIARDSYEKVQE